MELVANLSDAPIRFAEGQKIIKADAYRAYVNAQEVLARANAIAARIIADAERTHELEKERGFAEGKAAAAQEAALQMVETVTRAVDYYAKVEQTLVEIVDASLRRIIGEVESDELVVRIVRQALAAARNQKQINLRVHPDSATALRAELQEILRSYPAIEIVDVVPDARLDVGSCILETEIGTIDASVEVQLAALRGAIGRSFGVGAATPKAEAATPEAETLKRPATDDSAAAAEIPQ